MACSPHISWLISLWLRLHGHSWPSHLNRCAPSDTKYGHCKRWRKSKSFIRCQRIDALVAMTYYPWAARCPSGIYPITFGREEFFWRYLAWMGQGWPQHMRFCSCRSSITEVCLWKIKVLSLWGFTVSVEGPCLCPTLCCLSLNCCDKE